MSRLGLWGKKGLACVVTRHFADGGVEDYARFDPALLQQFVGGCVAVEVLLAHEGPGGSIFRFRHRTMLGSLGFGSRASLLFLSPAVYRGNLISQSSQAWDSSAVAG